MTPLAEILKPHMSLIVGALVFMFGLAIFVGVLMVLRRLWSRELGPSERIQDPEQLAAELHEEIIRLEELRDRLDPSYSLLGHDVSARPVKSKLSSKTSDADEAREPEAELAEVPGKQPDSSDDSSNDSRDEAAREGDAKPSDEYIKVAVKQATAELNQEITELNAQIEKMKNSETEDRSLVTVSDEGLDAGTDVSDELLAKEVVELKSKLADYQAFEDELALVKTYKEEAEKLRARIKEMETGQPQITDDDIASLFAEMGEEVEEGEELDSNPKEALGAKSAEFDSEAEENITVKATQETEPEKQVFKADPVEPKAEPKVFAADKDEPTDEEPEPSLNSEPDSEEEPLVTLETAGPSDDVSDLQVGEETAEAYAELGDEGDELLAQFEKVLSSKEETP